MKTSLSSGSDGSSAARPSNRAMVPVLIGIALIMLVSKMAGLLAVAIVCYMIIGLETAGDLPRSENFTNESLDSGRDSNEISRSKLEFQKQKSVRPSKTNPQTKSPLFATLPPELRFHIYQQLLISKSGGKVEEPHMLLEKKGSNLFYHKRVAILCSIPDPQIDCSILRTCRRVYEEGLPILYGKNVFTFCCAAGVRRFARDQICDKRGRKKVPPRTTFNLTLCLHGRLSMIRKLELKFGVKAPMYPWESFLLENRKNEGKLCVYFANLEWLVLDIRQWEVVEDNYLVIWPFTAMFRSSLGLKTLVLLGFEFQRNIEELKYNLLRDGGELFPGLPPIQRQINKAKQLE